MLKRGVVSSQFYLLRYLVYSKGIKYRRFECNIVEVRGTEMKTKCTLVGYIVKFCDLENSLQWTGIA